MRKVCRQARPPVRDEYPGTPEAVNALVKAAEDLIEALLEATNHIKNNERGVDNQIYANQLEERAINPRAAISALKETK